ncbi:helix-turn-helix domain-containing protein [Paenibacillus sp. JNUCC31]|uniref:AraC family transcriptional regulator n=1 Tax=Paenibacillus sp. JNUCC-31 TaxID=2777983 RepID=UPI0017800753|nr:AraC family transcriptional regulator [Paenibacillus sp. JNUCC-31]QOS79230.1 helix-turn-helix domain-containing protein [Paenibacillus sp. JNUCC-31]
MALGFEAVPFHGQPVVWTDRHVTSKPNIEFYHWHQCCELLIVFGGTGIVVMNNQTYDIRRGMLFVFQPFEIHKVYAKITDDCVYERAVIHLNHTVIDQYLSGFPRRREWFDRLCYANDRERAFDFGDHWQLFVQCVEDYERIAHTDRGASQEEITVFMLRLLSAMEKLVSPADTVSPLPRRKEEYSEMMMHWVETHYMESDVLNKLANELHLTRSYVSRLFKKETGSNLSEYLIAKRIKVAAHLLETTSLSVETISNRVGFQNVSHFISSFKKTHCNTPLKYRLNTKQDNHEIVAHQE